VNRSDAKRLVRNSYDRLGARYSEWARQIHDDARERYRDMVMTTAPAGGRVLDLGCGDGSLLTRDLAERYHVVGVDLSLAQLRRARQIVPQAQFICADATALHLPAESFDAVVAFYSLNHVPREQLPDLFEAIHRWLRPGGLFVGSFGAGADPGSVEEGWIGVPMFFSGHEPATNRAIVEAAGLEPLSDRLETVDEHGEPVTFQWLVAKPLRRESGR
jgi:ubiquinone/menaquinone biosynthesis C-methylase UbiE